MKITKTLQGLALTLAMCGIIIPVQALSAAAPSASRSVSAVQDVALAKGGVLNGQLLSENGAPVVNEAVVLVADGKAVARTETDKSGRFEFAQLRGGQFSVATRHGAQPLRVWMPNTAPPVASEGLLLTTDALTFRGLEESALMGAVSELGLGGLLVLGGIAAVVTTAVDDNGS
jgi:hypothetical protein